MDDLKNLHGCIDSNLDDACITLLRSGVDVNAIYTRETAFTRAIVKPKVPTRFLEALMATPTFSPDAPNQFNRVPVYYTALGGHLDLTQKLIKLGANVNVSDVQGVTPLMATCLSNHSQVTEELIKAGASVNAQDRNGEDSLMYACQYVSPDAASVLVNFGADVNAKDNRGDTVLVKAIPSQFQMTDQKLSDNITILKKLVTKGCNLDDQDRDGNTALHLATRKEQLETACLLMENGCNMEIKNNDKITAFQYALRRESPRYTFATCMVLYGCDVEKIYTEELRDFKIGPIRAFLNKKSDTVNMNDEENVLQYILRKELMCCGCRNEIFEANNIITSQVPKLLDICRRWLRSLLGKELVKGTHKLPIPEEMKKFLTYGANSIRGDLSQYFAVLTAVTEGNTELVLSWLNDTDVNTTFLGKALIHAAVSSGNEPMVNLLLEQGASVHIQTLNGDTVLHLAAKQGSERITKKLLEAKCDPKRKNKEGLLPLHVACSNGNMNLVPYLATASSIVNIPDNKGIYPLHYACANADPTAVEFLIEMGASLEVVDAFGLSPVHVIATQGFCYLSRNISLRYLFTSDLVMNLVMAKVIVADPYSHHASTVQRFESVLDILLKSGANINVSTSDGKTLQSLLRMHWPQVLHRFP